MLEGSGPHEHAFPLGFVVVPRVDRGTGRVGGDRDLPREFRPEPLDQRVARGHGVDLPRQDERIPALASLLESLDAIDDPLELRQGFVAEPTLARGVPVPPPSGHREQDRGHGAHRDPAARRRSRPDADPRRVRDEVRLQRAKIGAELRRIGVSPVGGLLEAAADDPVERRRSRRLKLRHRRRRIAQDRGQGRDRVVAGERTPSRDHLVKDDAEGEDVGARVDRLSLRLLGGHVGDGAEQAPRLGRRGLAHHRRRIGRGSGRDGGAAQLGQAEVQDLRAAVLADHDVVRLQVAVGHALPVRRGEPVGDGDPELDHAGGRQASGDLLGERSPPDQLHREEPHASVFMQPVHRRDVRVVERCEELRLALESREPLGVGRERGGQDLDRHLAVERGVDGFPDDAHAPFAEALDEAVVQQHPTGFEAQPSPSARGVIIQRVPRKAGGALHRGSPRRRADSSAESHLSRAFGFGNTSDFDPFLLLDDFRNDDPTLYSAGRHSMDGSGPDRVRHAIRAITGAEITAQSNSTRADLLPG